MKFISRSYNTKVEVSIADHVPKTSLFDYQSEVQFVANLGVSNQPINYLIAKSQVQSMANLSVLAITL